jgi:late competence protein required for DNA uptake (superfamily II DNA/RNA helicase)
VFHNCNEEGSGAMKIKCVECNQLTVDDKVYHYKGKSYCDDCYEMINAVDRENRNKIISSKMNKFGKGFKIPGDK